MEHEQQQSDEITADTETEMQHHETTEEPSEDRVLEPSEEQQEQLSESSSEFTFTVSSTDMQRFVVVGRSRGLVGG